MDANTMYLRPALPERCARTVRVANPAFVRPFSELAPETVRGILRDA